MFGLHAELSLTRACVLYSRTALNELILKHSSRSLYEIILILLLYIFMSVEFIMWYSLTDVSRNAHCKQCLSGQVPVLHGVKGNKTKDMHGGIKVL